MKFILEVNNQTAQKFSRKTILNIFENTLKLAELKSLQNKNLELSVALVDEKEIQVLNTRYRKKKSPTDVLSFCEYEKTAKLSLEKSPNIFLGELILCLTVIQKNAKQDKRSLEEAFSEIVAHGILHLLGFAHSKKMFSLQREVAKKLIKK